MSYRSEVRHSDINDLLKKVKDQDYGKYLHSVRLEHVRAFRGEFVRFDFPVTALIGTNGGGKSTILGSAAIAYKSIKPGQFFPKSSLGDDSMANWEIRYEIIDKEVNKRSGIQRSSKFKNLKWARESAVDRQCLFFGIERTVPAGEKTQFKKIASSKYKFKGKREYLSDSVVKYVEMVLGKPVAKFKIAALDNHRIFLIGGDGSIEYSEFHFGAGEASVIRMIKAIEDAEKNSLVLIEEIENGLHPIATRRMVEYLIDAAKRKSIQAIFTTHSDYALDPLPSDGIWSSVDGKVQQGHLSIETLRAISGRIERRLAIFVEDEFAKLIVASAARRALGGRMEEIGIYPIGGDGSAVKTHLSHRDNPAITVPSICILDGDSQQADDPNKGIFRLPGGMPEQLVFSYVADNIEALAAKLAVSCHLDIGRQKFVADEVKRLRLVNKDRHLIFSQLGEAFDFTSEAIVSGAFISLWVQNHPDEVSRIGNAIQAVLDTATSQD